MKQITIYSSAHLPALIIAAGDRARFRYIEFFTTQIRNPNTRWAYARNVRHFMGWLEQHGVATIEAVNAVHIVQTSTAALKTRVGSTRWPGSTSATRSRITGVE